MNYWVKQLFFVFFISDYDECNPPGNVHIPDCGNNATCVNKNMTYDCVCDEGFVKNDTSCVRKYFYM